MLNYYDYSNRLDPNCYTVGREGCSVLVLVCHNTAGPNDNNNPNLNAQTAKYLSDQAAAYLCSNDRQVSIHWLVGAEACGAPIYRIVHENDTAYHCGGSSGYPSSWTNPDDGQIYGRYGLNLRSIGIEVFGQPNDILGPNQIASLTALLLDIKSRYPIIAKPGHIVAHADLEADRTDGRDWVNLAKTILAGSGPNNPSGGGTGGGPVNNSDARTFPETGYTVLNYVNDPSQGGQSVYIGFLDYWNRLGLGQMGFPISNIEPEVSATDGKTYITQWFQRARLEYHPENDKPYKVLAGLLGTELLALRGRQKPGAGNTTLDNATAAPAPSGTVSGDIGSALGNLVNPPN